MTFVSINAPNNFEEVLWGKCFEAWIEDIMNNWIIDNMTMVTNEYDKAYA